MYITMYIDSKLNHRKISQTLLCPGKLNLLLSNKENKLKHSFLTIRLWLQLILYAQSLQFQKNIHVHVSIPLLPGQFHCSNDCFENSRVMEWMSVKIQGGLPKIHRLSSSSCMYYWGIVRGRRGKGIWCCTSALGYHIL